MEPIVKVAVLYGESCILEGDLLIWSCAARALGFLVFRIGLLGGFAAGMTSARCPVRFGSCFMGIFLSFGRVGALFGTSRIDGPSAVNAGDLAGIGRETDGESSEFVPRPDKFEGLADLTGMTFPLIAFLKICFPRASL